MSIMEDMVIEIVIIATIFNNYDNGEDVSIRYGNDDSDSNNVNHDGDNITKSNIARKTMIMTRITLRLRMRITTTIRIIMIRIIKAI